MTFTSTSTDDGSLVSYYWEFGDNSSDSGASITHTYAAPGDYTVRLTVTDNEGAQSTATQTITVAALPTATVGVDQLQTGKLDRKGNFGVTSNFKVNQKVYIRSHVANNDGAPVAGASVQLVITGPVISQISGEITVSGLCPNLIHSTKKGAYTVTVTEVTANNYDWDEIPKSTKFTVR